MTGKNLEPLRWRNGALEVIDQTLLPAKLVYVRLRNVEQVGGAIRTMRVRGAPLIGVVGAYGLVLSVKKIKTSDLAEARTQLRKWADILIQTRPTGVNLRWAVERIFKASAKAGNVSSLKEVLLKEADAIFDGELEAARRIGKYGSARLEDGDTVLTHCNAGALATVGYGTSLAVVRAAMEQGKRINVIATETRPLLQGSRLTAFELAHDKIPVKIIVDSAAAQMMAQGVVDKILVGADRILKTGHVTNKIGTLPIALSAKFYGVPFYVAAPVSTLDMATDPSMVVIEERNQREVLYVAGRRVAPRNVEALNPAFDITPPDLVTGIVTDRGVAGPPFVESLRSLSG
ncbi:S-methyl-5-thioribose-1-phosphate isomerase [archaeon 13_1_40CM_2_52_13]|nr:MAG: S-methyl-5-thioribose-1-phosphate isomerase [archaeon 13_1_40CM_2_52_13]OLE68384.1 MAG: S-methyl-5-thioribose-1-phosphate isomerase [archaeon 13_1_20CM_2_51_12]TMI39752.1 MAG: S-methyl-5-thioribose-1-phosphate isomerase [Candidatus Bathyarchaeota archaeon]